MTPLRLMTVAVVIAVLSLRAAWSQSPPEPVQPPLIAEADVAAIAWQTLSESERKALTAFEQEWAQLRPQVQQRLRRGAQRWSGMDSQQRVDAAERFSRWQQLDDAQRERIRRRFEAFRDLPPEQQLQLRRSFQQFRALPPQRRQELLRQFQAMDPGQREAFLLALRARGDAGQSQRQRLWDRVPPDERAATIAMMQGLDMQQRQALRRIAWPMSIDERDQLRRRLLPMTPEQRRSYILEHAPQPSR